MPARHLVIAAVALTVFALGAGCGGGNARSPAESITALQSPDAKTRLKASEELRGSSGVPIVAVDPLIKAIAVETVPNVKGSMLITLGSSGAPEAKPVIDRELQTQDKDMRRWCSRAAKNWAIKTNLYAPDYKFPADWPYGQPGYPPK